jgi:bacterioferritin-associated ferredoxin
MHLHGNRRIYTGLEDEMVCLCLKVQRCKIKQTIEEIDANTVGEVRRSCKAGGGCGSCHEEIARLIVGRRLQTTLDFGNHIIEGETEEPHDELEFLLSDDNENKIIDEKVVNQVKNFLDSSINPCLEKFSTSAKVIESGEEIVLDLVGANQELKYTLGFWLDLQFHEKFHNLTIIIA